MDGKDNKELVRGGFDAWARGDNELFRMLSDEVRWTITGSSPLAGTYTGRQQFLDEAIQPISARLSEPIRPTVRSIVAEDDNVVALWDGHATALDGVPYDNTYSWHMRLADGVIVEVTAFFDARPLSDLLERVQAP